MIIKPFYLYLFSLSIFLSFASVKGFSQNYSAAYFKNKKKATETPISTITQWHGSNGFYVKIARELLGCDFVITNAAGVMVLMGTFNTESFTFDRSLFTSRNEDYFLNIFNKNKQVVSERLKL